MLAGYETILAKLYISVSLIHNDMPMESVVYTNKKPIHHPAQHNNRKYITHSEDGTHPRLHPSLRNGNGLNTSPDALAPFNPFSYVLQSHHSIHSARAITKLRWQMEHDRPPALRTSRAIRKRRSIRFGKPGVSSSGMRSVSEGEVDLLNVRRATSRREGTREGGCVCVCVVD
jgi:hypothetical protein